MRFCAAPLRTILLAALTALAVAAAPAARAASELLFFLPTNNKGSVKGLTLQIGSKWPEGRGYRPVTINITCTSPVTADRTLDFEFTAGPWTSRQFIKVASQIEIPAGSKSVVHTFSVPQYSMLQGWGVQVWENGVRLDDLCLDYGGVTTADIGAWGSPQLPAILFVTARPLNLKPLEFLADNYANVGSPRNYPAGHSQQAFADASTVATFAEQPPDSLPEKWIDYSSLDVVMISLGDVQALDKTRPAAWKAIRDWARAGGNLCVYGVGDEWQSLEKLEKLLEIPDEPLKTSAPTRNWRKIVAPPDDPVAALAQLPGLALVPQANSAPQANATKLAPILDEQVPYVVRPLMMGQVAALAADHPFPGDADDWKLLFDTLDPMRWTWSTRHGLTMDNSNPDFDNYLIAEVGLPPVGAYRVLITVFVLGIGPLNYWFLRRWGRLHLLLFTVPVAALLVSGALVGYVVVADGLASRLRARSYTEIDQRNQQAVSWSRLSYYTGFAPSAGLVFSDDVAVLPLEKLPAWNESGARGRQLNWDGEQYLTRGWLYSRTPTQYLNVHSHKSTRGLRVSTDASGRATTVRNDLGTRIKFLMLRSKAGDPFVVKNIDAGAQAALVPFVATGTTSDLFAEVSGELRSDLPRTPAQLAALGTDALGMRRSRRGRYFHQTQGSQSSTSSLLERSLQALLMTAPFDGLEAGSYVAIVERPSEITAGLDGLTESQGLHVIRGRW